MFSNKKIGLILLFAFLMSFYSVYAQDFELTSSSNAATLCTGETALFTVNIKNIGSNVGYYTFSVDGLASSWVTSIPLGMILKPGESDNVFIYATPNSFVIPSNYGFNLVASSGIETERLAFNVEVKDCHEVQATGVGEKELCSESTETYNVEIKNTGRYDEVYSIAVSGDLKDYVSLSQNSVSINSGESKSIFAIVNYPANLDGSHSFNININSRTSNAQAIVNFPINILGCYDFSLRTSKDFVNFCENSQEKVTIELKNDGNQANIYNLEVKGPAWANLDHNVITLEKNQLGSADLILNPSYGIKGDFDIVIKTTSDKGKQSLENKIKATVNTCHAVNLDIPIDKSKICKTIGNTYEVIVSNNGAFDKDFTLNTNLPWATLSKNIVSLQSDKQEKINLEIKPDNSVEPGKYNVEVIASAVDSSKVSSKDNIEVEIVNSAVCYSSTIKTKDISVNLENTATLPIVIENVGSQPATYILDIAGTASSFVQLNPATLKLEPNENKVVYMYIAPGANVREGSYFITVASKLEDDTILASKNIAISVKSKIGQTKETFENETGFFSKITGGITKDANKTETKEDKQQGPSIFSKFLTGLNTYKYYVLTGLIILLLIIIFARKDFRKKISDFLEEEVEVDEKILEKAKEEKKKEKKKKETKPKKDIKEEKKMDHDKKIENGEETNVWIWVISIIILGVIVFILSKYVNVINLYKFFILAGLVLLLVIILIIKYWDSISKFLEEEPEKKEENKEEKKEQKESEEDKWY